MKYYVDTYSRVDLPTVSELRSTVDGAKLAELERADASELRRVGWTPPEVFVAKGRDGKTDIWGVIYRPSTFDAKKKLPVIESIYAGPRGSFVPKSFSPYSPLQAQAELGFIVVQIDGMGTSNRSKAFHDVAWQNLGDAGFPDRILWHKAVAAKYPYYDVLRVGIYGGSAGGQSALGALLFHGDFYKAAVSYAGCHDNRMDKIWWNEQWMGWPIGPQYAASSNVENAARLRGDLLLVVGELDTNVDPSSTMQVVAALLKAGKVFDLTVVPGAGHDAMRRDQYAAYGERKRFDFFVEHLLGQRPPDWNRELAAP
jgi:dipeptidyl aminopeptidase/acylaminoacyl peptidase